MSVDTIEKEVLDDEGVQILEVIKQMKAKGFTCYVYYLIIVITIAPKGRTTGTIR
ncbi:hypothetical protein BDZ91DRAFT_329896 [Kalaharituber pfeilii]|nr:hypothetical protein BDZ91DRAFT_329896 [Kalaharituber pfeilii]